MLFSDYLRKTESRADAGVIEFSSKKIRSAGVTAFIIRLLSGQFSHLSDPDSIQVFAGSELIVRCSAEQLNARIRRLSRSNFDIADSAKVFPIPFYLLDFPANWPDPGPIGADGRPQRRSGDIMLRYNSQFPGKLEPQVSLKTTDAGGIEAELGWEYTDEAGLIYPRYISQALGYDADNQNQVYDITQPGMFRGFCHPTDKLLRLKLEMNGSKRFEYSGETFNHVQEYESAPVADGDQVYYKIHGPEEVGKGTRFEADLDAGWDESSQVCLETHLAQP